LAGSLEGVEIILWAVTCVNILRFLRGYTPFLNSERVIKMAVFPVYNPGNGGICHMFLEIALSLSHIAL